MNAPNPPFAPAGRPLIIGHRGAPGYRPEHTRASYELAFALGADAVEPDLVASRDGVLVVRHENEISGTTDVASHPEFASRRTTKVIDGEQLTGWFTEEFTWAELQTLRAVERLPELRQHSATFDGLDGLLRLEDLLALVPEDVRLVAEVKHPSYFASIGLPLDGLIADALRGWRGRDGLTIECFEQSALAAIAARGVEAEYVYLLDDTGSAPDATVTYAAQLTDDGLARLAGEVDGISVAKSILLADPALVARAHGVGLRVFTWTLRPENAFLAESLGGRPARRAGGPAADWGDWRAEFSALLAAGVDGVFADHPDLAVSLRDER